MKRLILLPPRSIDKQIFPNSLIFYLQCIYIYYKNTYLCQYLEIYQLIEQIELFVKQSQQFMRDSSRSRSRSPTSRSNQFKGANETPTNKVYVTFLPEDIQESKLKELFEECGTVTRLFLKKKDDGFTFAHIHYQSVDQAINAISSLNKRKVGGKNIKVQFSRQRQMNKTDNRQGSRDKSEKFGDRYDKGGRNDFRKQSDTRRRFQNDEGRGRGRGRGGGGRQFGKPGDRGGGFRDRQFRQGGGERGPLKCYKCQGQGHMAKNCQNSEQQKKPFQSKGLKGNDKMSQDQQSDY